MEPSSRKADQIQNKAFMTGGNGRLKIVMLATNGVCFGACVVMLVSGSDNPAVVFLAIGTGLGLLSGVVKAVFASQA